MAVVNSSTLDLTPSYAAQLLSEIERQLNQVNAIAFVGYKSINEDGDLTSRALFDAIEQLSEERTALIALRELISRQAN